MVSPLITSDLNNYPWQEGDCEDITTAAPQKLWRTVHDVLAYKGYICILRESEPTIKGMAIGDTGTSSGEVLAESSIKKVENPLKILGIILIILGVIVIPGGILISMED